MARRDADNPPVAAAETSNLAFYRAHVVREGFGSLVAQCGLGQRAAFRAVPDERSNERRHLLGVLNAVASHTIPTSHPLPVTTTAHCRPELGTSIRLMPIEGPGPPRADRPLRSAWGFRGIEHTPIAGGIAADRRLDRRVIAGVIADISEAIVGVIAPILIPFASGAVHKFTRTSRFAPLDFGPNGSTRMRPVDNNRSIDIASAVLFRPFASGILANSAGA